MSLHQVALVMIAHHLMMCVLPMSVFLTTPVRLLDRKLSVGPRVRVTAIITDHVSMDRV